MKKLAIAVALGIGLINTASAQIPGIGFWVDFHKVEESLRQYCMQQDLHQVEESLRQHCMQQKQGQQPAEKKQQIGSTIPKEK